MSFKASHVRRGLSWVIGLLAMACFGANLAATAWQNPGQNSAYESPQGGVVFSCPQKDLPTLAVALTDYFEILGVKADIYDQHLDDYKGSLQFVLRDRLGGTDTLNLIHRVDYDLKEELIQLPAAGKKVRTVVTVSQKEILLALLQSGRTTRFTGQACTAEALRDQIGVRQNTVAWSESLEFMWPNGKSAHWNTRFWNHGNLRLHQPLHMAVADVFMHTQKYSIGCYTATKLIVIQGILDYYRRIKHDLITADAVEARLMQDGEPLSYIEPGEAWYFEKESSPTEQSRAGKLVFLEHGVAADNFVPGDWSYFLNTDPVTYEKTGYEGSNSIYLGRGKFDDYYNDSNHSYTYKEKLLEVYQWRHRVFSRERDVSKIHPLTAAEIKSLGETPENGGIELAYRMTPYAFGFAELPGLPMTVAHP
jgi:hypothetical protein